MKDFFEKRMLYLKMMTEYLESIGVVFIRYSKMVIFERCFFDMEFSEDETVVFVLSPFSIDDLEEKKFSDFKSVIKEINKFDNIKLKLREIKLNKILDENNI